MVLNALTYPLIVVVMALGVAAFMVIYVIPKIQRFLGSAGRRLPAITQLLVDVSNTVMNDLPYIGVGMLSVTVALICGYQWPPGRRALDGFLLRTPVIGRILRLSGTAVFARGMSTLLESGVTLLDSLTTVERLISNRVLSLRIAAARQAVLRGESLASTMGGRGDFLPMLGRMIAVGETAGTLSTVLTEVAQFHESQLVISIRRMSIFVEPVLILVVGGIVGFVYIAFFVAIFSLAGGGR
jgi:type IV pilus assembly protein PilC